MLLANAVSDVANCKNKNKKSSFSTIYRGDSSVLVYYSTAFGGSLVAEVSQVSKKPEILVCEILVRFSKLVVAMVLAQNFSCTVSATSYLKAVSSVWVYGRFSFGGIAQQHTVFRFDLGYLGRLARLNVLKKKSVRPTLFEYLDTFFMCDSRAP